MSYPTGLSWQIINQPIGMQPIATVSATQLHPIGTIVRAVENGTANLALGEIEAIYLKGAANVAAGDLVVYDLKTPSVTRVLDDTGVGPAAVALAAVTASKYGWFAIAGSVPCNSGANTVLINKAVYMTGTASQIDDAAVAGDLVTGAATGSGNSGNYTYVTLNRPFISQAES